LSDDNVIFVLVAPVNDQKVQGHAT